jgi:hypothetical protein
MESREVGKWGKMTKYGVRRMRLSMECGESNENGKMTKYGE